ncbi:hypothetical protein EGW08_017510 [Elysia chlorotica]|uniref:Uncharacterized protein n=1 Tax=Elysia chlorotica TaxID=188477 RepID=A0A3S1B8M7_ELYCH|nr:hypothetical protein EGW08_017510 [Elysia chlorotica]
MDKTTPKRPRAMSVCSEKPFDMEPSTRDVVSGGGGDRSSYIRFRSGQLRSLLGGAKLPKLRDDLLRIVYSYRRYRSALSEQAALAKKSADAYRSALTSAMRSFRTSFDGMFPKGRLRYTNVHSAKYADMIHELNLINSGEHGSLSNVNDVGTLKENVLGRYFSIDDPVISEWLGVVGSPKEESTRNLAFAADGGKDGLYESFMKTNDRAFIERITNVNTFKLASDFVNKISEEEEGDHHDHEEDTELYEIFALLPEPGSKTSVYRYWDKHCREKEKRWYDERIVGAKRFTCDLLPTDTYLKPKTKRKMGPEFLKKKAEKMLKSGSVSSDDDDDDDDDDDNREEEEEEGEEKKIMTIAKFL